MEAENYRKLGHPSDGYEFLFHFPLEGSLFPTLQSASRQCYHLRIYAHTSSESKAKRARSRQKEGISLSPTLSWFYFLSEHPLPLTLGKTPFQGCSYQSNAPHDGLNFHTKADQGSSCFLILVTNLSNSQTAGPTISFLNRWSLPSQDHFQTG